MDVTNVNVTDADSTSKKNINVSKLFDKHINQSQMKKFKSVDEKSKEPTEEKCIVRVETPKKEA